MFLLFISFFSIITAYGCSDCAGVAFCSPTCASIACSTHHRFECKFIDLLVGSGMSILCFVALRMITQHNDISAAIEVNRRIILNMCSHSQRRNANDYLQRSIMSAFLLRILQKSDYFGRRTSASGRHRHTFKPFWLRLLLSFCFHLFNFFFISDKIAISLSE